MLTCLAEEPPADAFRPPYAGTDKPIYRAKDLKWDLLLAASKPADARCPRLGGVRALLPAALARRTSASWTQQQLNPNENQPNYGREHARLVSIASLMLHLDVPKERKEKLLIGLVQYGIDIAGVGQGRRVLERGRRAQQRAQVARPLRQPDARRRPSCATLPETAVFHEDTQTYYGKGWFGQTALWQMVDPPRPAHALRREAPRAVGGVGQDLRGLPPLLQRGRRGSGTALAARLMKAITVWEHDAFFDYCDRWMRPTTPTPKRAAARAARRETQDLRPLRGRHVAGLPDTAPNSPTPARTSSGCGRAIRAPWVPNPRE